MPWKFLWWIFAKVLLVVHIKFAFQCIKGTERLIIVFKKFTYMTNSQKGVTVGFLPLKTLNNFLRIKHKDIYFCSMMHFEVVIAYMQKEITYVFRFSYTCFYDKKCLFFKEKTSHFGEGCFLATPVSTAGVFSQIFTTHPTAKGLGNNLLYGSVGSNRKSQKISVSLHISVNFHLQH